MFIRQYRYGKIFKLNKQKKIMKKVLFFVILVSFIISCQNQYRTVDTNYDYKVVQIEENETKLVTKKLNQISDSDVIGGNFIYQDADGGYIVTDILKEQDRQIAEAYPPEEELEYIYLKYYNATGRNETFVKYNKKLLSHHPDFKSLDINIFMDDYYLNNACASMLQSYERLKKCNFGLSCQIEADLYFERWCMKYLALATNNETWCDKIRLSLDDQCYWFMADQKKDERLCLKINKGDVPIMKCLKDLAIQKGNPKICNLIQGWYEEALIKAGKEANLSIQLTKNISEECVTKATEITKNFPFRTYNYTKDYDYFDKAKLRIKGTIMERLLFGDTTLEDCEFLRDSFNSIFSRRWYTIDFSNTDHLVQLCLTNLGNCSHPSPAGDYCSYRRRGISDCERKDYQSGWDMKCLLSVGLNSFGKNFDNSLGDLKTDPFSLPKRLYSNGWIISNADIRTCLDISVNVGYCLNSIAGLWLDCNVCSFVNDENDKNLCEQTINKYSNGKISCL